MAAKCDQCGKPLDSVGNCQACLLQLGISQAGPEDEPALQSLPSLEQLNAQFPQLDITRLIGRGGMGAIYHARQTALDRDVAIKLIAKEVAGDTAFIERFEREAKTLAKLSHPNIVTVYDFGRTADGQVYLIMEYVDGINLREAINSQSVGSEDALEVVATICRALEYAHGKGVVHRDIKPENILLGEDGTLKVADFGIAKIIDDSVRAPTLTATRQVLGSLHYLAPEHLEAPREVDHRVDLYALGVVFYELLTGQLPLGRFEPPSVLHRQVDGRLDAVVMKTLSRKPKQRYQHASELNADIEQLRTGEPAWEPPPIQPIDVSHAISVPFSCEAMGGFAEAVGIVHTDGTALRAEYRVRDAFWGNVKSKTHVVEIPVSKLSSVEVVPGVFSSKIVIVADTITTLGELPNAETGRVEFKIKRNDRHLAEMVVDALGFGRPMAPVQRRPVMNAPMEDLDHSRWVTLAILMIFCGILNAGLFAVLEVINVNELRDEEFVMATLLMAVLFGPTAMLQFITGLVSLVARPRSLARAAAVVSMLPIAPAFLLSMPTGLWAYWWLKKTPWRTAPAARPEKASKGWGATTLQFIRESRWSKLVAGLNALALVVCLAGLWGYNSGYYRVTMEYRIVDTSVDGKDLSEALRNRLGGLASMRPISSYGDSKITTTRLILTTWKCDRSEVVDRLAIEGNVELVWLAEQNAEAGGEVDCCGPGHDSGTIDVAPGLSLEEQVAQARNALGDAVITCGSPMVLESTAVARLSTRSSSRSRSLSMDLSPKGREVLAKSIEDRSGAAGLGLVVDGILEGFANRDSISGKRIVFELASSPDVTSDAIVAALRGPAISSDLELIE